MPEVVRNVLKNNSSQYTGIDSFTSLNNPCGQISSSYKYLFS